MSRSPDGSASRVALVSTWDRQGGAARAAQRLHRGLRAEGVDSTLVVQSKSAPDWTVMEPGSAGRRQWARLGGSLENVALGRHRRRAKGQFSAARFADSASAELARFRPAVVHLHWINAGHLSIGSIAKLRAPVVWTLHDMWPFTGGCHYAGECRRFEDSCGACPWLASGAERDLSRSVWRRKERAWRNLGLTLVTPSRWMAEEARASSLFRDRRIEVIPNGLDLDRFRPIDPRVAREVLGIPRDALYILFGAMDSTSDPRKGFQHLQPALRDLAAGRAVPGARLLIFGASEPRVGPDLGLPCEWLGTLEDEVSLSLVYSAADVFVAPSVQDNLPNTVAEASACGVPTVAFGVGGLPEMVDHEVTGYLARPFDALDLADGIRWVLGDASRHATLGRAAREKAERTYSDVDCARRHLELYRELGLQFESRAAFAMA